ncbi:M12 family metallopeptidase [Chitinophaga pendula]|uniref:M12 family metallopeptidase n=1 Tax=Chitinophaga TaxID=79328 RepID=UPI000BB0511F|nr:MULTISPECIES: M12 family metallopeptidase [Chitinophaga]ASZ12049.1 hypothetical protein CK934_14300 [Chitinophaga sp. MD30]UCJ04918.1 M12 family metallopeptidase [Chitinophaga pendula]
MNRKTHFAAGAVAIAALLSFAACNKPSTDAVSIPETEPIEVRTVQIGTQELTYARKGGLNIFEGDIALSDQQLKLSSGGMQSEGAGVLAVDRWPQARIYYTIASNMYTANRQKITDAINHYNQNTRIRWIPRTNESNYVVFIPGASNGADGWAAIGMWGGLQNISLDAFISLGSVIHEMGHAAGLYHEHTRRDRDQYIRILWNNIQSGQSYNFNIYNSGTDYGTFDFNSVMMYWPTSYSANGQPTIVRANGSTFTYNRGGLTAGDISALNTMYP